MHNGLLNFFYKNNLPTNHILPQKYCKTEKIAVINLNTCGPLFTCLVQMVMSFEATLLS